MPSPGDYTGYRAETQSWVIRDLQESQTPLTGWETDEDGNLVCTGGGAIMGETAADPVVIASAYNTDGEPLGEFLRIVSNNQWNPAPEDFKVLSFDETENEIRVWDWGFTLIAGNAGGDRTMSLRSDPDIAFGQEQWFSAELFTGPHVGVTNGSKLELRAYAGGSFKTFLGVDGNAIMRLRYSQSASDPTASDIPDGYAALWKKTGEAIKLWANAGGSLTSVALA